MCVFHCANLREWMTNSVAQNLIFNSSANKNLFLACLLDYAYYYAFCMCVWSYIQSYKPCLIFPSFHCCLDIKIYFLIR